MQPLGFFMKLIFFAMVILLTLASEINPPLHDKAKKGSKKPKNKQKKNDKSKVKKPKSGLYYLQAYQQKYGSTLIKVNEILNNVPQIQQYSIVREIYPQKQLQKTRQVENVVKQLKKPKSGVQYQQYYQQKQESMQIKVNEILSSIPQIQQYSIVREIYPPKAFQKRRETQNIVKQLKQKWTIEESKQLLESNQKLAKLNNQIAKYIDNQHQKKQPSPAPQKKVDTHVQAKPLQDYQRPNKQQDKKKNDLIQEIKKQLMQKQLLRKQKEKQEEKNQKQAQQIRKFDQQQKQLLKKQVESEQKLRKQRQKQQAAKSEQVQRKKKIELQKYRKQQQMQMSSIAKSFESMLSTNPKMQDLLRKKIQAEHQEEEAIKREEERKSKQKLKAAQPQNIVQENKQIDVKSINKNAQATKQSINIVNIQSNQDQQKQQQRKQQSMILSKKQQINEYRGKEDQKYQQINNPKAIPNEKGKMEDLWKSQQKLQVANPSLGKQDKPFQIIDNKNKKKTLKENVAQQLRAKSSGEAQPTNKNDISKQHQKQKGHMQDKPSLLIKNQQHNIEQNNHETVAESNSPNINSIAPQKTKSMQANIKKEDQGAIAQIQKKSASQKQVPKAKQGKFLRATNQMTNLNINNKGTQDILRLKQIKQSQMQKGVQKQSEKPKNEQNKKKKPLNIQDIFGITTSKAQLKQQLINRIKKYEQKKQVKAAKKSQLQVSIQSSRPKNQAKNKMFDQQQSNQQVQNGLKQQTQNEIMNSQKQLPEPQLKRYMRLQEDTDKALFQQLEQRVQNNKKTKQKLIKPNNLRPKSVYKDTPFIQYVIYFIFALFILLVICSKLNSFNRGPYSTFIEKSVKSSRGSLIPEYELEI